MNFKRIKTTAAAGILAASMILPNMTAFAAESASINKTVHVADGVTSIYEAADKNVTFSVNQVANASGNKAPNEGSNITGKTVTIDVSDLSGAADNAKVFEEAIVGATSDTGLSDFSTGEYTFEIKETTTASNADFGWTAVDSSKIYYLRVVKTATADPMYFLTATNVAGADKLNSADFENTYNKKSVDGSGAANPLDVTLTIDDEDLAYLDANATYPVTVVITAPSTQTNITSDSYTVSSNASREVVGNTITIKANLKAGETINISNIAVGATYSVTEDTSSLDGNFVKATYQATVGTTAEAAQDTAIADHAFGETSQKVEIHDDFQNITITGVVTDIAPYVTLVVVAVAAIAAYVAFKKRVAR